MKHQAARNKTICGCIFIFIFFFFLHLIQEQILNSSKNWQHCTFQMSPDAQYLFDM